MRLESRVCVGSVLRLVDLAGLEGLFLDSDASFSESRV